MIEISIVIPTHNRASLLAKHLLLLKEQSLAPDHFEVIVVADGCSDDTGSVVSRLELPYQIRLLEQNPGTGASGARNRGAASASAGILLFLDDDMEPHGDLLRAHLQAHRETPGAAVLGHYPMQPPEEDESVFTKSVRLWWAEKFATRATPGYRFSFWDFCTGNVSVTKNVFDRTGGFDESIGQIGAGEDYELGYRLIRLHIPFRFARDAESVHHSKSSWKETLRRAREEGYGQSIMARKHPELFWEFNVAHLSRLANSTILRPCWIALWRFPGLSEPPIAVLRGFAGLLLALNVQSIFWRLQNILRAHAYWRGVILAFGSLSNWERLAQDAPYEPSNYHEVDLDVGRDLEDLEEFMRSHWPVEAIRVFASGQPVGRIAPWAAGEPMNSYHVKHTLIKHYGSVLLGQLVERNNLSREVYFAPHSEISGGLRSKLNGSELLPTRGE